MGRVASTRLRVFAFWVFTFFIAGYFAVHGLGLGGERGILTIDKLNKEMRLAKAELSTLKNKREWLEHRVRLVSKDEVDEDLLGELARKESGLFATNEIVIELN